jgi:hypothetical protein
MAVVLFLLALGLVACSGYGEYADSYTEGATEQSTVLPTVPSGSAEPAPQAEEAKSAPSTIDDVAGEETRAEDQGRSSARDEEVERANRWMVPIWTALISPSLISRSPAPTLTAWTERATESAVNHRGWHA